jgi:hypothetical protein
VLFATPSRAGIVWDYSPDTTGATINLFGPGDALNNYSAGQNFAERVSFASTTSVSGMAIYSYSGYGAVGDSVVVRLWSNASGVPGALLQEVNTAVSVVDIDGTSANPAFADNTRKFASFGAFELLAGETYWIGMSGTLPVGIGQQTLDGQGAPDDESYFVFNGLAPYALQDLGDLAFRLYGGSANQVPEPSTLPLIALGLAGTAIALRRLSPRK